MKNQLVLFDYEYYHKTEQSFYFPKLKMVNFNSQMSEREEKNRTCNDPSVEVESHFPGVLEDDRLEEVAVSL